MRFQGHLGDDCDAAQCLDSRRGNDHGGGCRFYIHLTRAEWCWIILAIVSVWTAEALNTAFEFLTDVASPEFHPMAEKAKDVAAGAVLITAIGSVLIGLVVFGPYLLASINGWRQGE